MKTSPTSGPVILGVDPGTNVLGYAVLHIVEPLPRILDLGVLQLTRVRLQEQKLHRIFEHIQGLIEQFLPVEMAIEAPFFGKNPQSMLKLGRAQGVAIAAGMTKGLLITEYSPKKIKQSVTGNGNASKEQVAAMLSTLLKVELHDQVLDATDALATALCHFYQTKNKWASVQKATDWGSFIKDNPGRIVK